MVNIPSNKALILSILLLVIVLAFAGSAFNALSKTALDPVRVGEGATVQALIDETEARYQAETQYLQTLWADENRDFTDKVNDTMTRRTVVTVGVIFLAFPVVGGVGFAVFIGGLSLGLTAFAWSFAKWRQFLAPTVTEIPNSEWYLVTPWKGLPYEKNKVSGQSRPVYSDATDSRALVALAQNKALIEAMRSAHQADPAKYTPLLREILNFIGNPFLRTRTKKEVIEMEVEP